MGACPGHYGNYIAHIHTVCACMFYKYEKRFDIYLSGGEVRGVGYRMTSATCTCTCMSVPKALPLTSFLSLFPICIALQN